MTKPEPWMTIYPTLAAIREARFETLAAWDAHLPPAQTDVEHTIRRRLRVRTEELLRVEVRAKHPEIAEQFNAILDKMAALGIKSGVDRF